ncbi:MAG: hypothetical protein ABIO02_00940 [Patescibacteria group bacterium]
MGKKLFLVIVALSSIISSIVATPSLAYAQDEAGSSAMLKHPLLNTPALQIQSATPSYEIKKSTIRAVLKKYNSPLTDTDIDEFITQCKEHEMDCYFMPSIWGVESQFCKMIAQGTNNCNGWGGGYLTFSSFKENIKVTGDSLKSNYIGKGAVTVESVGRIYASSGTWPMKVRNFQSIFEAEEKRQTQQKNQLNLTLNTVK